MYLLKNTAPYEKKSREQTQNHPKNLPDWQSQVVSTIFKGFMAIYLNV